MTNPPLSLWLGAFVATAMAWWLTGDFGPLVAGGL